jgi:CheY-like chemotaxis protein
MGVFLWESKEERSIMPTNTHEKNTTARTILVVEDDKDIGELIVHAIQQETPYQAALAENAFKALDQISVIKPHMFLLDYQLPGMDGLELYNLLHTTPELETTPVLFMSANFSSRELDTLRLPYLEKPFGVDELLQLIVGILEK